jgi:hypothetical protein
MVWCALSPKQFRLFYPPSDFIALRPREHACALFYERHPLGGRMEEEMYGLSEGLLELGCLPGSASSDSSPLPASDWRAENALTRSGGETDGPCTRICDSPAQPCPPKVPPASYAHVYPFMVRQCKLLCYLAFSVPICFTKYNT